MQHRLKGGTLKRMPAGIEAQCECGWSSVHFTSLSASAAFRDHQESAEAEEKTAARYTPMNTPLSPEPLGHHICGDPLRFTEAAPQ